MSNNNETRLQAYLDGELTEDEASAFLAETDADSELATELRRSLLLADALERGRRTAPASLQRRLASIPSRTGRRHWWVAGLAASLTAVVVSGMLWQTSVRREAELARAQEELAVAIHYLRRTTRKANHAVGSSLQKGALEPVATAMVRQMPDIFD